MKFRVHLGWMDDYMFDSADEAMRFAITAKVKREGQESSVSKIVLLSDADLEAEAAGEEAADD